MKKHNSFFTQGKALLITSVITRVGVICLLCLFALWTEYLNLKVGYNLPRLVELAQGKNWRIFYEASDWFFSLFGDPVAIAKINGGMTWAIRVGGFPFTDPIAAISILAKDHSWTYDIALGLLVPLTLVFLFGRIFCSYICPASLVFFLTARLRNILKAFFYLPNFSLPKSFAWGVLFGGITLSLTYGHGVWSLILPYFSMGQTIFNSIAFGTLPVMVISLGVFFVTDLLLGHQFTCRYLCPTGRLLGFLGSRSLFSVRRDSSSCIQSCSSCTDVCPLKVNPKIDDSQDCSLCGECLIVCPSNCLSISSSKKSSTMNFEVNEKS